MTPFYADKTATIELCINQDIKLFTYFLFRNKMKTEY